MIGQLERPIEMVQEWLLNEYIVSGRYPGDLAFEGIGQLETEEALQAVHRIHVRLTKLIEISQIA
jgi:hypothetical protein